MEPELQSAQVRRIWIPYFVLGITLCLTGIATDYVARTARTKNQLRFDNAVIRTQTNIQDRLETYIAMLRAGTGLFAASESVSLKEFRAYVEKLELPLHYPGIQGIGFSQRVLSAQKDAFVARMQQENFKNFKIKPVYPRSEYHTIVFLEPLDTRNQAAIGFDMFTESVRRMAMVRARDTGKPALSGLVTLVQELDEYKQAGFLIYVPVYRNDSEPKTEAERREALVGFVYSPFRAGDLFEGIFGTQKYLAVDFKIYDGIQVTDANLLYSSVPQNPTPRRFNHPRFATTRTLKVAGRTWTILYTSRPEFNLVSETNLIPYIFLSGVLISFVLFLLTRAQAKARMAAEDTAAQLQLSQKALRQRELRLRRFVEANIIGIIIRDLQGNIVETNDAFLALLGYSRQEWEVNRPTWQKLIPEKYQELERKATEEMLQTGSHSPFEKELIRKDQTRVPVLVGTAYVGELEELSIGFIVDLREQKEAEAALRERETRYRLVFQATNDVLWDWNLVTNEVEWNEGIFTLFGYTTEQVNHSTSWWQEKIHPEDRKRVIKGLYQVIDSGQQIWSGEYRFLKADQSYALIVDRGFIAHNELKVPVRMIGSITDITERKQAEAEREKLLQAEQAAREQAEAANRMKDEFLATLSHELRTPLNAISGWTQLLRSRNFNPETTQKALETIERNTKSLTQLIEDLLDVSRIMAGKFRLEIGPVEMAYIIESTIESVQPAADAKNIEIRKKLDTDSSLVSGDATRLQQVTWNLLSNAIKFTPKGGWIEIRLERCDSNVQMSVIDPGQGIAEEFLPYVFDRFRQADADITRSHGGLGLGLAIVRNLVELHGGKVWASSQGLDQGSTFTVALPLRAVAVPIENYREKWVRRQQSHTLTPEQEIVARLGRTLLQELWVLVVDDEPDARELVNVVLQDCGARVTTVGSAGEAFTIVQEGVEGQQPAILVSDIGMPGEDGYSLIRRIRALPTQQSAKVPAIALTAYARAEDRARALAAGFDVHLSKPVKPQELIVVVAQLTGRLDRKEV